MFFFRVKEEKCFYSSAKEEKCIFSTFSVQLLDYSSFIFAQNSRRIPSKSSVRFVSNAKRPKETPDESIKFESTFSLSSFSLLTHTHTESWKSDNLRWMFIFLFRNTMRWGKKPDYSTPIDLYWRKNNEQYSNANAYLHICACLCLLHIPVWRSNAQRFYVVPIYSLSILSLFLCLSSHSSRSLFVFTLL